MKPPSNITMRPMKSNKNLVPFALLLVAILSSYTFSPQYLIWVAPFAAFLDTTGALLFIGASSITWVYFRYWGDVIALAPLATGLLIIRNTLLIILFLREFIKIVRRSKN